MAGKLGNITFYADDPPALARFWAAVFGYPEATWDEPLKTELLASGLSEADLTNRALAEDPEGWGRGCSSTTPPMKKDGRNRLHLDISATPGRQPTREELEAEKDRLVALGAEVVRMVDQSWGPWPETYFQMRDPEGNEFCLQ